ncbi:glycosyltransferase [Synechococcus sp. AH-551-A10]|nr:glycosyltransferase [Synechococcus sp. AH-551-A10]MDB4682077.1 glycosyltransferase [Synechococcus sp. AH-551-A10]
MLSHVCLGSDFPVKFYYYVLVSEDVNPFCQALNGFALSFLYDSYNIFQINMKVLLCGNTNNYPLVLAQGFRDLGHDVCLAVTSKKPLYRPENKHAEWADNYPEWIIDCSSVPCQSPHFPVPIFSELKKALPPIESFDLVILNHYCVSLAPDFAGKVVSFLTGSDLTVLASYNFSQVINKLKISGNLKQNRPGLFSRASCVFNQRFGIVSSDLVCYPAKGIDPQGDYLLQEIGVNDTSRYMLYLSNTTEIMPIPYDSTCLQGPLKIMFGGRLNFDTSRASDILSPSSSSSTFSGINLDDKGIDLFLKGFIKFIRSGHSAQLTLFRKGSCVNLVEEMLRKGNISGNVQWLDEVSQSQFYDVMNDSHVIVDSVAPHNFPAMVSLDAYAMGKVVMANMRDEVFCKVFSSTLPGLNVVTPDDVFSKLSILDENREYLQKIGSVSRSFALDYLSPTVMASRLIKRVFTTI